MLLRASAVVGAFLSASLSLGCSDQPEPDFEPLTQDELSIDEIVLRADAGVFTSVDEVLEALPEAQKQSVVLLEHSTSMQRADAEHPRMILYGPDARFIVAVSTSPSDPRFETLEMMELDEDAGRFRLAAIRFGEEEAVVEGEGRCVSCHGRNPRPIWGEYPDWPGAYASDQETLSDAQRQALPVMRADDTHRFRFVRDYISDDYYLANRSYGYPNTNLNFEIGPRIAEALVTRAQTSPEFERFRPALLGIAECSHVTEPDVVEVVARMQEAVVALTPGSRGHSWEPIYEIWGLDLILDFAVQARADQTPPDGEYLTLWNVGSAYLDDLVRFLILEELLTEDATLAAPFARVTQDRADILRYGWELRGSERAAELVKDDDYNRNYLAPQSRVMSPALGEFGVATPERLAFCRRLGEIWNASAD